MSSFSPSDEKLFAQAKQLMQERQHEQALPLLRDVCARNPDQSAAWHALGLGLCPPRHLKPDLHTATRQAEALKCYQQASAYAPTHPLPWECQAYLYNLCGDYAAAEYHSIRAIDCYIKRGVAIDFLPLYCLQEALFEQSRIAPPPLPCHLDFRPLQQAQWPHPPALPPGIQGNWPHADRPIILLSADQTYFDNYLIAQIVSLGHQACSHHLHVHVLNPTQDNQTRIDHLAQTYQLPITMTYEQVMLPRSHAKVYFASRRLQLAAWLLELAQTPVLWTDADILFRTPEAFIPPDHLTDIALVDYQPNGLCDRYGAAWVWLAPTAQARKLGRLLHAFISAQLTHYPDLWMVDQIALYMCVQTLVRAGQLNLQVFPPLTVSCNFEPDAPIWNGSGPFKHGPTPWNELCHNLLHSYRLTGGETGQVVC